MDKYDLTNAKVLSKDQEEQLIKDLLSNYSTRVNELSNPITTIRYNQLLKEFNDFMIGIDNKTLVDLEDIITKVNSIVSSYFETYN